MQRLQPRSPGLLGETLCQRKPCFSQGGEGNRQGEATPPVSQVYCESECGKYEEQGGKTVP